MFPNQFKHYKKNKLENCIVARLILSEKFCHSYVWASTCSRNEENWGTYCWVPNKQINMPRLVNFCSFFQTLPLPLCLFGPPPPLFIILNIFYSTLPKLTISIKHSNIKIPVRNMKKTCETHVKKDPFFGSILH